MHQSPGTVALDARSVKRRWLAIGVLLALACATQAAPILEAKIGDGLAGSLTTLAGPVYQIMASGTDVWGTADDCYFVYQQFDATQPLDIWAQVGLSGFVGGTNDWRKAGIMIRQSLTDTSIGAEMLIAHLDTNGVNTQIRKTDGASKQGSTEGTGTRITYDTPAYLRLEYLGDGVSFNTYYKKNLGDPWLRQDTPAFNKLTTAMTGTILGGLFVTAHDPTQQTTVQFGDVNGFVITIPDQTLTWDGHDNEWGDLTAHAPDSHWLNGGILTPEFPTIAGDVGDIAIVPSGAVSVGANRGAYSLTINGGSVTVGAGNTLTLLTEVKSNVAGGLVLQNGTLDTRDGTLVDLQTSGGGTVNTNGLVAASHLAMAAGDTLVKGGPGTVSFSQASGNNTLAATNVLQVNAGELSMKMVAGSTSLGGADLTLNGGTFTVEGQPGALSNVLQAGRFNDGTFAQDFSASGGAYTDDQVGLFSGQQLLASSPGILKLQAVPLSYSSVTEFNSFWGTTGDPNEWQAVWTGYYVAQQTGNHQFRIQSGTGGDIDDDGSLWVDANRSGTFQAGEGGTTGTQLTSATFNLTAGLAYAVAFGFNENTGGESYRVQFIAPSGPYNTWTTVDPIAQAGYWQSYDKGAISLADTSVAVQASSTLNAVTAGTATFGPLTFQANSTLTTQGAIGGIYFNGTTLSGANAVGFNTLCPTYPGALNDGGVATITKTGTSDLILDAIPVSLLAGTTLDVQAGRLISVGSAPLGSAGVRLNGGELALTSAGGGVTVNNTLTVAGNSTLSAGRYATGVVGPLTVTVNNLLPNAGTLTTRTYDNYTLSFPNGISGTGSMDITAGTVQTSTATNLASLILTGGTFNRVGAAAGTRDVTVSTELRLAGMNLDMTAGGNATLTAGPASHVAVYSGRTLTLPATHAPLTVDRLTLRGATPLNPLYLGGVQSITATSRYDFTDTTVAWNLVPSSAAVYIGYDDASENPVYLNGTNQYTGETWIRRGTLRANEGVGLPVASRLVFDGNTRDESSMYETRGTFARNIGTGAGEVYWNNMGGFAAVGGNLTVTLEGGAQLIWNSAAQGFNNVDSVQFGSRNATGMVELTNAIDLAGAADRRFQIENNTATKADFVRLSGNISGGSASNQLRFNESAGNNFSWAFVELTGTNTYLNATRIDDVTLFAIEGQGLPTNSLLRFEGNDDNRPAVFMSNGTMARNVGTSAGQVRWDSRGGFAARGGDFVVTLNSNAELTWTTGFNGQILHLNSPHADSVVELTNPLNLEITGRNIRVFDNRDTDQDVAKLSGNIRSGAIAVGTVAISRDDHDSYLGTLWLSGTNTYTGITRIADGFLRAQDGVGLPATSNLHMTRADTGRPDIFESWGTFTRTIGTAAGQVTFAAAGTGNSGGGFAAWSAPLTITLQRGDSAALPLDWDSATNGFNGSALCGGSQCANNVADMTNDIMLGTADRTWRLFDNPYSDQDVTKFSGIISNQGASGGTARAVLLDNFPWSTDYYGGGATVWFSGANIYTGRTQIDDAVLRADFAASLATSRIQLDADSASRPAIFESWGTLNARIGSTVGQTNVTWANNGGGFAAWSAPLTVTLLNSSGVLLNPMDWGSSTTGFNGTTLMLGSPTANDTVELTNNIGLGGADRTIRLFNNFYSTADIARLSGVISNQGAPGGTARALTVRGDPLLPGYNATDFSRGILELVADNTYTGDTHVYDGATLLVTGSINMGGGTARAHASGIIGGTGTVGLLSIESGGVISPGAGPGTLTANRLSMLDGAIYDWELLPEGQDLVHVLGDLDFGSTWVLRLFTHDVTIDPNTRYLLFAYDGQLTGSVENCIIDTSKVDMDLFWYWDASGAEVLNDPDLREVYLFGLEAQLMTAIPEPATMLLVGAGLLALARRRRPGRKP